MGRMGSKIGKVSGDKERNMNVKYVFFRNDDVRNALDESLVKITNICIENKIPISHAVEPANVTREVVNWLLELKKKYPDLVEIIQHGYSHKLNYQNVIGGKLKKGEFGGDRSYAEQFKEITEGKKMMDELFGELWFPLFTFPYGARNDAAIKAVSDSGFLVINGSMGRSIINQIFYSFGRLLQKEILFGRKISWHLRYKPSTTLFQIDTSFSLNKKFINEETKSTFFSLEELKEKTNNYLSKYCTVGIVLHHRYHDNISKIELFKNYIKWIKTLKSIEFVTQEKIYNLYK